MCDQFTVNEEGHLLFAGRDTVELAEKYGTPLYLMDENLIRENMRAYRDSITRCYDGRGLVCYASKAFSCKEIYRIAASENIGVDVVSMGELYTALSVGFDPTRICYHGNNKTEQELIYALEAGVDRIVVDSFEELSLLDRLAGERNLQAGILLRLTPGVDAHTHDFVMTGQIDSKFGFSIPLGIAAEAVRAAIGKKNLRLRGVHCHIGSQIFELQPFTHTAEVMLNFMAQMCAETGYLLEELNLGGGFGIRYTEEDDPLCYGAYMDAVSATVAEVCQRLSYPKPFIIIEPGRSVVGSAGMTLYTVGTVKEIPGVRTYVSVDGGMTDNVRFALYGSKYTFCVANRGAELRTEKVTVAGRCCESGDLLGKDILLQKAQTGDILAVLATGAYNYAMSSNYNRTMRPPVVMVKDGVDRVVIKRETLDDLIRNDL